MDSANHAGMPAQSSQSHTGLTAFNIQPIIKIGENLAVLRKKKGVTQEEVAAALGISNKTISKWETGLSIPEAEYISLLADYFEVSIDEIFGRANPKSSFTDIVAKELKDLSVDECVNKTFELLYAVIRQSTAKISTNGSKQKIIPRHIVSPDKKMYRCSISCGIAYEMLINSPYTNMAVALYQNEENYSWLDANASELANLFRLLSDVDGIKLIKLMYTDNFSDRFTVDYIAAKAGVNVRKANELLDLAVTARLCNKLEANLRDGVTFIYECTANGMVLAILNLAYELICGAENNEIFNGYQAKLIRGEQN